MRGTGWIVVLALGSVLGCESAPRADREAELEALRAAALAYYDAASNKDREAVVSFYDADAVLVPPDAERVEGIEGVRSYRFGFIETPGIALEFEILRAEVSLSGDVGWTLANGDITITQGDDPPTRSRVRDVHTWHKQVDGSWKIVADVWNSEPVG